MQNVPYAPERLQRAGLAVADARKLSGTSALIPSYEHALAEFFQCRSAVAVSNGTMALKVALRALGVTSGSRVALPATAPVMTALAILDVGALPMFLDTAGPLSFGVNLRGLDESLVQGASAAIEVPMWGYPIDLSPSMEVASKRGVPIVEDAAQAHGSRIKGRLVGTQAIIGCFSTHDRKLLATGEGGFVITDSDELATNLRALREFGSRGGDYGEQFGTNAKLAAPLAAIGREQLSHLPTRLEARRSVATGLRERIQASDLHIDEVQPGDGCVPNYYALLVDVCRTGMTAREIAGRLNDEGIETDTHRYQYRPCYSYPILESFQSDCPNVEVLVSRILTLPCHERLTEPDLDIIVDALRRIVRQRVA